MARKLVKIGENNGKIYVSGFADRPYRAYNCMCTICGREFIGTGQDVFNYYDTGCTVCRKKQYDECRLADAGKYIGRKFGELEIVDISGFKSIYGRNHLMVSCKCCKCGNIADYVLAKVKSGQVRQCQNCNLLNLKTGREISQISHIDGTSITSIDGRRKTNRNSTTGFSGVSFHRRSGKYRAYITFQRKQYHLGMYSSLDDAVKAREEAEKKIYGEFLKWYSETYPDQWKRIRK